MWQYVQNYMQTYIFCSLSFSVWLRRCYKFHPPVYFSGLSVVFQLIPGSCNTAVFDIPGEDTVCWLCLSEIISEWFLICRKEVLRSAMASLTACGLKLKGDDCWAPYISMVSWAASEHQAYIPMLSLPLNFHANS